LPLLRSGGFLHLYVFQDERRPLPADDLAALLAATGRPARSLAAIRCGHCGRARYRYCLDCHLE